MFWMILAITAAIIWGLDYTLGERVFNAKISPSSLLTFQLLFGGIIFFFAGLFTKKLVYDAQILLTDKKLLILVLTAIITFNLGNYLIFLSIEAKNATLAGVIELSYPLFTILFSWLLFRINHFNIGLLIGGMLIFLGVLVISFFCK